MHMNTTPIICTHKYDNNKIHKSKMMTTGASSPQVGPSAVFQIVPSEVREGSFAGVMRPNPDKMHPLSEACILFEYFLSSESVRSHRLLCTITHGIGLGPLLSHVQ